MTASKTIERASSPQASSFGLHILAPPSSPGALNAQKFAQTALETGHHLALIFFNGAGVLNAQNTETNTDHSPQATKQTTHQTIQQTWLALARQANISLSICTGSANHYQLETTAFSTPWQAASLGDLLTAYQQLDRIITFRE